MKNHLLEAGRRYAATHDLADTLIAARYHQKEAAMWAEQARIAREHGETRLVTVCSIEAENQAALSRALMGMEE